MLPNGIELSRPADAGNSTWTLGQDCRQDKDQGRRSPPGQPQRVWRSQVVPLWPLFDYLLRDARMKTAAQISNVQRIPLPPSNKRAIAPAMIEAA